MKAALEAFNGLDTEVRKKCKIKSMEVKALYPSMSWNAIVESVIWMIGNSEMVIENVDWHEVGKYLAVMMTREEIPKRRDGERRLRKITMNYLHQKKNQGKWLRARRPGVRQQRRMLAQAVSFGVRACISNHT